MSPTFCNEHIFVDLSSGQNLPVGVFILGVPILKHRPHSESPSESSSKGPSEGPSKGPSEGSRSDLFPV